MSSLRFETADSAATRPAGGSAAGPSVSSHAYLVVRGLTRRFGAFTALDRIDLEVRRGEFVCFLGPSGCGKTTLLRAIAGLDRQDEGRIEIGGRDVSHAPPADRDFGIVFQSYALFPNLTVNDNVAYGLVNRRRPRAEIAARVKELLALVGLPDQGAKFPVQLSGGQQQRVALARALATSPGLLLLDEPLSALDARVRLHLREEIRALQNRLGVTTIMVTHDQEEALAMADRIVVMNHGVIEQVGTPEDIYRTPASAFVADFVGTMSFLDGKVSAPGEVRVGTRSLRVADGRAVATGYAARVGLRPEDVRVRGVRPDDENAFEAIIEDVEFLGAFCRARLVARDEPALALLADFSANLMRDVGVEVGKPLLVALPPESLRVFARSSPIAEEEAAS
ncbi:putative 2-aminoethylphosphonate ABC transporter ATP-binding protein [Neoroseomonas oryzicola]|uniref:2-aminoethylphosphonate ABC transporter ATP-binding protein n=1 Tax=Neoroseomonas oryzicola TaxID=535904 RepID=A0A9X9WNE2_9PROT|nr:putative 2-aminoethylphosphonate ABC transporter ATP-binding protein [Neoroseomonas oryzicola]MBR0661852.1 putative 2-aminoethylphosphonate ABC transporter ATP-binding protein [Neoroseomonas oryzicola]NKE19022.1 putative 2-aminoethylphosphonate ABC transporter ATP-binding protein [Neoroseomonas oryzicola]